MCHDPDSRPPAPPAVADLDSTGPLELTAADGAVLAAYEAIPFGESRARVVLLPDVRGLHPYYRVLTEQFAQAGLHTVAIDYFGRTAGAEQRTADFDWEPHLRRVTHEHVLQDAAAAVRHVSPEGTKPVFTVGFCYGGGQSWRLAAGDLGLAGAIGFYGIPTAAEDVVDDVEAPILMLVAGADAATPVDVSLDLARSLEKAGKEVETHVYDGAPHSFFDRSFAEHEAACADAWQRLLGFVEAHRG
jgi:carboxymethylenebutenolidase